MSRAWNGESLVNEFSSLLGDTSAPFKTRVTGWINDVIFDISSRHDWGHHLVKGKKLLHAREEIHNLEITPPEAPTVAIAASGELAAGSTYKVLVTFVQANGVESMAGAKSESIVTTEDNKAITLSDIPYSPETLVTKRNIYLKKDDGDFYFHSSIADNFTDTLRIDTETDSEIEPPDFESIRRLNGSPFFEEGQSNYLEYRGIDQLRRLIEGAWTSGSPEYFSPIEANSITTYPIPSVDLDMSFNYYRMPFKLYNSKDSQPDLPIALKPVIKAGVIALGYEYRDRDGQENKKASYEQVLMEAINRGGKVANIEYSVRDVYGNTDGFEVG